MRRSTLFALAVAVLALQSADATADGSTLYQQHCAACHGADRFGGIGPALLPENLARLRKADALNVIGQGRVATQMPGFTDQLSAAEIEAVRDHVYTSVSPSPTWDAERIRASRTEHAQVGQLPAKPVHRADPLNLFVVVESGDHHVTILDGDRFETIARFQSRYALHGGPKFSPDGRFVYFASRDGWISKYDLWGLRMVAEVRAGLNTRNAAVSSDGRIVAVANYLPHTLVLLDDRLQLLKIIDVADASGKTASRVSAVYDAAPRRSFVAALKDVKELWEISYDPKAPEIAQGLIHDFRYREGSFVPGFLNPRRTQLDDYLDDFFFTANYNEVIGASRDAGRGQVVHLDVRRRIAALALPGLPHLGSGITWERDGRTVMATPNLKNAVVTVVDTTSWKPIKEIATSGPGFFLRSHERTPYAWVDGMMGAAKDTLQIIDKRSLEIVGAVTPSPGKTAAHVEFTRDGRYALVSVWELDGALVVYDAHTLAEVKRLPMKKPVGKYNVHNKITRSEGTSH
uniref:Putative cytochrome d1 NirN heme region n=1 Tax=uncultured bacterium 888 TaxID=548896 RepID=B8R8P9_9BACT|nr:putative cytochrome d1 NirN heme region [uncultured bacterium 888]